MVNQENYGKGYNLITEYRGQPINVRGKEIEMSFDLYKSQDGYLGWSKHQNNDKPCIHPLLIKASSATHLDIGQLLSEMVRAESKKSLVTEPLEALLANEYLVAMILSEIGSDKAP